MLRLNLESALYTELDLPRFNPDGFLSVQQAVELAQQDKALAQTPDDLQRATHALRTAGERKNLEQQMAQKNFEAERQKAFWALKSLRTSFLKAHLTGARRLETETRIDHLITLFNLKDFDAVHHQIPAVKDMLRPNPPRPVLVSPGPRSRYGRTAQPQSATALFQKALALERSGNIRQAVEVYSQVLERNPRHLQAIHRLQRINGRARKAAY